MRAVSEEEFLREAKPVLDRVFATENPFDPPFALAIQARIILFPVHYAMDRLLSRAIKKASSLLNENSFYLSALERPKAEEQDRPYHWLIPFTHLEEYRELGYPFVLENAIYSTSGTWGVMFSHERHAVLGGPPEFVQVVTQELPKLTDQVETFIETWKRNQKRLGGNVDWLIRLLTHVYGDEQAQKLMAKADLPFSVQGEAPHPKGSIVSKMGA